MLAHASLNYWKCTNKINSHHFSYWFLPPFPFYYIFMYPISLYIFVSFLSLYIFVSFLSLYIFVSFLSLYIFISFLSLYIFISPFPFYLNIPLSLYIFISPFPFISVYPPFTLISLWRIKEALSESFGRQPPMQSVNNS